MTARHDFWETDLLGLCLDCGQPPDHFNHRPAPPPGPPAAAMNRTGSPTGRVRSGAPGTSVTAARRVPARSQRSLVMQALTNAGRPGATSIELARQLPARADGAPQPPNIAGARLSELWEDGTATVERAWGCCRIGVCHPHEKPGTVHRALAACDVHGPPVTRDGAAVWISTYYAPRT